MTWICTDEAWTCPTCEVTVGRGSRGDQIWVRYRRSAQDVHAKAHRPVVKFAETA